MMSEPPAPERDVHPPAATDHDAKLIERARKNVEQVKELLGPSFDIPSPDSTAGYEIIERIGSGGQAIVFRAIQKSTGQTVAIKSLRHGLFSEPDDEARFRREVSILAGLKHPGIVTIHDFITTTDGNNLLVMSYISGGPLDSFIDAGHDNIRKTLKLFLKVCDAVNAAHECGIIHRDLKPNNILIDDRGEPHVLDFGLGKTVTADTAGHSPPTAMTVTGQFLGSLPWASPEQVRGVVSKINQRSDVYSLGVVLFQALTGRFPYDVTGPMHKVAARIVNNVPALPRRFRRDIGRDVEIIVLKCLSKDTNRRYASADDLAQDIGRYLRGEPIKARPGHLYRLRMYLWQWRWPVAVGSAVVVALIAAVLSWHYSIRAADQEDKNTQQHYSAVIRAANDDLRAGNAVKAAVELETAPVSLRGWELAHLEREAHPAVLTLQHAARSSGWSLHDPVVQFSPDSTRLLSASTVDDTVKLWDVVTGQQIAVLPQQMRSTAFSSDGTQIAWVAEDGASIAIWTGELSRCLTTIPIRSTPPTTSDIPDSLVFNADGTSLIAATERGGILQWAAATGEQATLRQDLPGRVAAITFTARGLRVVTCEDNTRIAVWDTKQQEPMAVFQEQAGSVTSVALSPDGAHLASGSTQGRISIWSIPQKQLVWFLDGGQPPREIQCLRWSPDGRWLASGDTAGVTRLCESATGRLAETFSNRTLPAADSTARTAPVSSLAFSPDVHRLASAYGDYSIVVWDVGTGRHELTLWAHSDEVKQVAFSTNGARVASVSLDGTVRVFDTVSGAEPVRLHRDRGSDRNIVPAWFPEFIAFHPHGDCLALASNLYGVVGLLPPSEIEIYNLVSGENLFTLPIEGRCVSAPGFSADGTELGCISNRGIRTWNTSTHGELAHIPWQKAAIRAAVIDPPTRTFLTVAVDGDQLAINVGDTSNQDRLTRCGWKGQPPTASAVFIRVTNPSFSHKDNIILGITGYDLISLDLPNRRARRGSRLQRPTETITCATITPDGTRVVTGSSKGIIQFWEPESGWEVAAFPTNLGGVAALTFSQDGSRLAVGTARGYISIWDTVSRAQRLAEFARRNVVQGLASRPGLCQMPREREPVSPIIPLRTERGETEVPSAVSIVAYALTDTSRHLTLRGSGCDNPDLSFTLTSKPTHGTLGQVKKISRDAATIAYTPEPGFSGEDSFSYIARHGDHESLPAQVWITVKRREDKTNQP